MVGTRHCALFLLTGSGELADRLYNQCLITMG